jgi:tetratricopeptide (TPR) repeat protein
VTASPSLPEWLRDRRTAIAIVATVASLTFANSLANGFAYDDHLIITINQAIKSWATLPGAIAAPYWPGEQGKELGLWRPTTTALLGVQHILSSGAPMVFHAVNLLVHTTASVLVLLLLVELMTVPAALAGALVFAVHPVHVEAVSNVIGVAELASTAALLAACVVHLRGGAVSTWRRALAVGLLYAVGFGAKESAVTLPGLIFLLDAARGRLAVGDLPDYLRRRWRAYVVMVGVAGALLLARSRVLGSLADPLPPLGASLLEEIPRIWTLAEVWTHWVRLWVLPLDLSADYSPDVIPISFGWNATNLVGVALALAVLVGALVAWRRAPVGPGTDSSRLVGFGVVWFLIAISPVSNVLFLSGVLLAERTLYLPSVGLAAATGWLVVRLSRESMGRRAWALLVVILLLGAARSWTRTSTWRDNPTMLSTLIDDYPQSGRSQWILGDAFLRQGRVSEALRAYRAAVGILGTHYQLMTELAQQLMQVQHYRAAEQLLRVSAASEPEYPLAHALLALTRAEHGDAPAAEAHARASLERYPSDPTRWHLLAWALAAQGRLEEARSARARGLELGEGLFWQRYAYQAYDLRALGDTAGARTALDSAWTRAFTDIGRAALDSVRVTEFGLSTAVGEEPPAGQR